MAGGSKLVRVCICEEYARESLELHAPELFCPACQLWPAARQLASAGEALFPGWTSREALTELMEVRGSQGVARCGSLGRQPLQEGCGPGDPRSGRLVLPAASLGPVAFVRLPALPGPVTGGGQGHGFELDRSFGRRMEDPRSVYDLGAPEVRGP